MSDGQPGWPCPQDDRIERHDLIINSRGQVWQPCVLATVALPMKFWPLLLLAASCLADTVTMQDGSFLKGRIERIAEGTMEFRTPSLGAANLLHLDLSLAASFVTDEPAQDEPSRARLTNPRPLMATSNSGVPPALHGRSFVGGRPDFPRELGGAAWPTSLDFVPSRPRRVSSTSGTRPALTASAAPDRSH